MILILTEEVDPHADQVIESLRARHPEKAKERQQKRQKAYRQRKKGGADPTGP